MNVDIIGPITGSDRERTGHGEDYHVHADGCGDCAKYRARAAHWQLEVEDREEAAAAVFEDIMAESGEDAASYLGEFWFAPCVADLPQRAF